MELIISLASFVMGTLVCLVLGYKKYLALAQENARYKAQLEAKDAMHDEKIAALTDVRKEIEKDLASIATVALQNNNTQFIKLAEQVFEKQKKNTVDDLEARKKAVEELITPLNESFKTYKTHIDEMEKTRIQSYGALTAELKIVAETQNTVRNETSKLVNALRAAPKTRGRWGEHTLRNVLELAGLSQHCDFNIEQSFEKDGALLRPDVIINLPGQRKLVIDAKTPLTAYLDAAEADTEEKRETFLTSHVRHVREHVKQLSSKAYWDMLAFTPDFVVMFIPGDNFYTAAVERDASLFEEAAAKRVVIVTPATLIALAKAVAYGWRQEKVAENAQMLHEAGSILYKRLTKMLEHIENCGGAISSSVKHYNAFIGSLESQVLPQARKMNEMEVEGTSDKIETLKRVELETRSTRAKDFESA